MIVAGRVTVAAIGDDQVRLVLTLAEGAAVRAFDLHCGQAINFQVQHIDTDALPEMVANSYALTRAVINKARSHT